MFKIDIGTFAKNAMHDPEFSREMRYFDGHIKLGIGANDYVMKFEDGVLAGTYEGPNFETECRIFIKGDEHLWAELLAEYPRPFFQCAQSANIKHGLILSSSDVTFAYLPAINRMISLLRKYIKEA